METPQRHLGLWTGFGLVVANMVGAGVFLSSGFMAQTMGPGAILLAWVVGGLLALAGAYAYAALARLVPRSGGEYRYLSDLLHPSVGYLAGWASLLLGFSAPVAIDAIAAGAFMGTLVGGIDPRVFGAGLVVILTVLHAIGLAWSRRTQNVLVVIKLVLILAFILVGISVGQLSWPTWKPPSPEVGFPLGSFMTSLFFIAFAFSGWNAAAYAAQEFRVPERDVPRAMLLGCGVVGLLYLLVNWVLIANLTPQSAAAFGSETSRITLGHLVMQDLLGEMGARAMSALVILALVSSMSAMTFAGPRVYAAMASDGVLPRALAPRAGRPPRWSVVLQGVLALVIIAAQQLAELMQNLGAVLTLFAGLTTFALLRVRKAAPGRKALSRLTQAAAVIYSLSAAWMLYFGFRGRSHLLLWLAVIALAALAGHTLTRLRSPRPSL